ncbi:hypothetical protein NCAS_0A02550 [Naumovozyma castellii]|uniref:E3 ubiquitin protein ligase n=1 Tax=Naumovozyma castellii TaxID=27288 RepID=G0V5S5_NAUCA|nr:hypothetical protein NCAS_0A02550 [Naumovozyma castellii CBS 4309]CCC66813.1 hypothetical protein NCAS_0A02550 [Naumovozyma castellii CBS 4309]
MSVEPPQKKIKLELSDPAEPLTQNDVISFQKEALFRCLHQHRVNFQSLKVQYDACEKDHLELVSVISSAMGCMFSIVKLMEASDLYSEEDKKLCKEMLIDEDDINVFVKYKTQFINLISKAVSGNNGSTSNADLGVNVERLLNKLSEMEASKTELFLKNKTLQSELTSLKKYYEILIKKYDREDSATVSRVFNKDTLKLEEEKENSDSNEFLNDNRKDKIKVQEDEPSTNALKKDDSAVDLKNEKESPLESNQEEEDKEKQNLKYELKISDLEAQIQKLQSTITELEKFKNANEEKLLNLNAQLSNITSNNTIPENGNVEDRDTLLNKIQYLTQENRELAETNEAFLNKFQKLSSEQEIFNNKVKSQFKETHENLLKNNQILEKDLVRIRTARDDLLSKIAILEKETTKSKMIKDLQTANEILTEQWNRVEERSKSITTATSSESLLKEIQDMEKGFKELSSLVNKKYSEYLNHESVISKLSVEKTKADQKYFAAMRSKDSILIENKNLLKKFNKTNELILQYKDTEKLLLQKLENINTQLIFSQNNEKRLISSNKSTSSKIINLNSELNNVKKSNYRLQEEKLQQTNEATKVNSILNNLEIEKKNLQIENSNLEKKFNKLKESIFNKNKDSKLQNNYTGMESNESLVEELENFRTLVYCSLCSKNWKNMAIKTCGHVFCEECCKERLAARMRKCPTCNNPFSANDLLLVHL